MSMQELTDDQLDGLFRKSAEEFDSSFDPAAWQAMQNLLDEHDRTVFGPSQWRNRLIRWGTPLLLLLLLMSSGWYYLSREPQTSKTTSAHRLPDPLAHKPQVAGGPAKSLQPTPNQAIKAAGFATKTDQSSLLTESSEKRIPATEFTNVPASNHKRTSATKRTKPTGTYSATDPMLRKPDISPLAKADASTPVLLTDRARERKPLRQRWEAKTKSFVAVAKLRADQSTTLPTEPLAVSPFTSQSTITDNSDDTPPIGATATTGQAPPGTGATHPDNLPTLTELSIRPGQWPKPLSFANRPVIVHPDTTSQNPFTAQPATEKGISVRFVVSPDLSAVGLKNFARPGTNVGLMLEYRLAGRWSVQAGVLRSTKVYNAQPSDYEWPKNWYWAIKPQSVGGQCNMLDIPINLRYDLGIQTQASGQIRSRWFISGGATSYMILRETYTYNYATPNDPKINYRNLQVDGISRYGFSQLNLSVGYERAISRRLSWQVEPFMKVPLKGVGFFKINLLSTGSFFSLRYKL